MNWVLALATAALLIFSFPGHNFTWLAPFALAPLMIAACRENRRLRRFWLGYVSGVVYWFFVCNWIQFTIATHGGMSNAAAWAVFTLFCLAKAIQTGVFALVAGWTMRTRLAVPATAALWVLVEYTHAPLGFAWLNLGNAGIDMMLPLRIAPLAGVWGISFLFAAIAAEVANLAWKRFGIPGFGAILIPLVFLLPAVPQTRPTTESAILVQPNIDENENWTARSLALLVKRMNELSLAPLGVPARPSILVWPEAPAPFYDDDPVFMAYARSLARSAHVFFLAGVVAHTPANAILNSVITIDPEGRSLARYDKNNLVPFGEFIPWPLGPIAFKVSPELGDFQPGAEQVVTSLGAHRAAAFICYESVFPRFIGGFVRKGAEVLFNPSNDGWFGKTAARFQHLEIVRMRAAENQRWILRDTNDGITAAIDPAGRVTTSLGLYQEASAAFGFSYQKRLTLYTRWGDWFLVVCLVLLAASCVELRVRLRL